MDSCLETQTSLKPEDHFSVISDVSSKDSVNDCFKQILDKYKRAPDIIVNSAGITKDGFLLRMKEEDFDRVISVNLKGTYLVTQAGASLMKEQRLTGSIVNIASIVGKTGNVGQANYTASKAGVVALTKTTAYELAQFGIRCNAVLPGYITTPMTGKVPPPIQEQVKKMIPMGRFGTPGDIANACLFLASEQSGYI